MATISVLGSKLATGLGTVTGLMMTSANTVVIANVTFGSGINFHTYSFDGAEWSFEGTQNLVTPVGGFGDVKRLTPTLAVVASNNGSNQAYIQVVELLGGTWSPVGSSILVDGGGDPRLARLSNTDFVLIYNSAPGVTPVRLTRYTFNGSSITQVGNVFTSPGSEIIVTGAGIDENSVAIHSFTTQDLSTYTFDGVDWSETTSPLSVPVTSQAAGCKGMVHLGNNILAGITDPVSDLLVTVGLFVTDGGSWEVLPDQFIDSVIFRGSSYVDSVEYTQFVGFVVNDNKITMYSVDGLPPLPGPVLFWEELEPNAVQGAS